MFIGPGRSTKDHGAAHPQAKGLGSTARWGLGRGTTISLFNKNYIFFVFNNLKTKLLAL